MSLDVVTGVLLILVPLAFNVAFLALGRAFEYPDILRKEPDEILRRFHAGGPGLILRWEALLLSALAMLPLAALLGIVLAAPPALTALAIATGAAAALVQALGLVRWPYAVPELARRYVAGARWRRGRGHPTRDRGHLRHAPPAARRGHRGAPRVPAHRRLDAPRGGVDPRDDGAARVAGLVGIPIGVALLVGTLEFVGPNERDGWPLAGTIVPIAYIAWSVWLILLGVLLLV